MWFSVENMMLFNAKKSTCVKVCGNWNKNVLDMEIGDKKITWSSQFKYLGVSFLARNKLQIDCLPVKRKFYTALNCILGRCKTAAENVKIYLVKAYCLPLLMYSIGALDLSTSLVSALGVCWNDAFRKIFGMNRWESVKLLQFYCDELPFNYLYDLHKWNFLYNASCSGNLLSMIVNVSDSVDHYSRCYRDFGMSSAMRSLSVKYKFKDSFLQLVS